MAEPIKTKLKFDGEGLENNFIDVKVLAPSLMALSDLIYVSNRLVNGDKTRIDVKVNADVKQDCFELLLMFDWGWVEHAKDLLEDDRTRLVKELLEWLGIFAGTSLGLFSVLKRFKGKPIEKNQIINEEGDNIIINSEGGNVTINKNTYNMYNDPLIKAMAEEVLSPLQNEGIDSIEFYDDKKSHNKLNYEECKDFLPDHSRYDFYGYPWRFPYQSVGRVTQREIAPDLITDITTEYLILHRPELNKSAKKWSFLLDGKSINVDISETSIIKDAISNGVRIGDTYKVELEKQIYGEGRVIARPRYKILEVLEFIQGSG